MPTLYSGPPWTTTWASLCHRELGMTLICWLSGALLAGTLPLQVEGCPAPLLIRTDTGRFTSTKGQRSPEPRCCGAASGHFVRVCSAPTLIIAPQLPHRSHDSCLLLFQPPSVPPQGLGTAVPAASNLSSGLYWPFWTSPNLPSQNSSR